MHWLLHVLGLDSASGPAYLTWSGFGGDVGDLAIAGALIAMVRRHNCEVRRCWRLGRHATAAGHHVCRRHHPDGPLTAAGVAGRHRRAARRHSGEAGERLYDHERDAP